MEFGVGSVFRIPGIGPIMRNCTMNYSETDFAGLVVVLAVRACGLGISCRLMQQARRFRV